ncbi:glycosyltransferase [Crocinitomix algicola]|uniref:glycosyltransferase n=1 Tax=Crocinitomix algicola TaxID=1740263 RepID=UPI00082A6A33|nr:glycosyltransferase family 2 protein [Crocinitomix algicola]
MNFYLDKYGFQPPSINTPPRTDLGLIVVIPCFNEKNVLKTLESLFAADRPKEAVEIILVVNSGVHHDEGIKTNNQSTVKLANTFFKKVNEDSIKGFTIHEENLPKKHAGVGLARKIGMDEAVARFDQINKDGIIACFDADAICEKNYLTELIEHFKIHPKSPGCAIHFEHPLSGQEFSAGIYSGITNYELHLRYYKLALEFANLPYAFHTVGSSMAVRSLAYQKQGGMNKRKAGEDFYFIHKIIALGGFTELKTTKIIPSPRVSDRVPFGTGRAVGEWISGEQDLFLTYNFDTFSILKFFIEQVPRLYSEDFDQIKWKMDPFDLTILSKFLEEQNFQNSLSEIRKNSSSELAFVKRFFTWMDAFKVLKMVHFFRDNGKPDKGLYSQVNELLKANGDQSDLKKVEDQLHHLRQLELK